MKITNCQLFKLFNNCYANSSTNTAPQPPIRIQAVNKCMHMCVVYVLWSHTINVLYKQHPNAAEITMGISTDACVCYDIIAIFPFTTAVQNLTYKIYLAMYSIVGLEIYAKISFIINNFFKVSDKKKKKNKTYFTEFRIPFSSSN
uniref:Uncharacterized protein n=1 Tax=Glossina brevipalpis TaxID=37001 RepID=A0A1A9WEU5_9MUSC